MQRPLSTPHTDPFQYFHEEKVIRMTAEHPTLSAAAIDKFIRFQWNEMAGRDREPYRFMQQLALEEFQAHYRWRTSSAHSQTPTRENKEEDDIQQRVPQRVNQSVKPHQPEHMTERKQWNGGKESENGLFSERQLQLPFHSCRPHNKDGNRSEFDRFEKVYKDESKNSQDGIEDFICRLRYDNDSNNENEFERRRAYSATPHLHSSEYQSQRTSDRNPRMGGSQSRTNANVGFPNEQSILKNFNQQIKKGRFIQLLGGSIRYQDSKGTTYRVRRDGEMYLSKTGGYQRITTAPPELLTAQKLVKEWFRKKSQLEDIKESNNTSQEDSPIIERQTNEVPRHLPEYIDQQQPACGTQAGESSNPIRTSAVNIPSDDQSIVGSKNSAQEKRAIRGLKRKQTRNQQHIRKQEQENNFQSLTSNSVSNNYLSDFDDSKSSPRGLRRPFFTEDQMAPQKRIDSSTSSPSRNQDPWRSTIRNRQLIFRIRYCTFESKYRQSYKHAKNAIESYYPQFQIEVIPVGGFTGCFDVHIITNDKSYQIWNTHGGDPLLTSESVRDFISCLEGFIQKLNVQ